MTKTTLIIFSLAAVLFVTGCGRDENANTNANANANRTASTPLPTPPPTLPDPELQAAVEKNLQENNLTGVRVEVQDGVVTLRGSVTKDQLPVAMMAASKVNPKRIDNQLAVK